MTGNRPLQTVVAVNGFAYGVIGADLHVFQGSGVPLYLLAQWRPRAPADGRWLRRLPSRMLDARAAIVSFTGRGDELAELRRWRDSEPPLALRWLFGPGGQGKTRLADQLAAESADAGWKVVVASLGTDAHRAEGGHHDLTLDGAAGVLLLVDYGDGWPATSLAWLLANTLLTRAGVPARVLVLARTDAAYPAVSARLHELRVDMSRQPLDPLPGTGPARAEMFHAARHRFADLYGLADPSKVTSPVALDEPELGLTLTLHVAALVAVDAAATGARPPADAAALTAYLLHREHLHWERLRGDHDHELEPAQRSYLTAPQQMRRAVFVAALTGPLPAGTATALLQRLELPDVGGLVADHAVCYPPSEAQRALEPVYPDRLAEDFLALSLPGHHADYPSDPWAGPAVGAVLARDPEHGKPPQWTARALTFLLAAAPRWPHVGPLHLYPLLLADPGLAAGSGGVLNLLAALPGAPIPLLQAVLGKVPGGYTGLEVGRAALVEKIAAHALARRTAWRRRAGLLESLARALGNAGRYAQARAAAQEAVDLWRRQLRRHAALRRIWRRTSDREWHARGELAVAQQTLAASLSPLGDDVGALAAYQEVVDYYRALREHHGTSVYETEYVFALNNLALSLAKTGHAVQARAVSDEAVQRRRKWAAGYPAAPVHPDLAALLGDSVSERRRLWELSLVDSIGPQAGLASVLVQQSHQRAATGDVAGGFEALREAWQIYTELGRTDYARYEVDIARCLDSMSIMLSNLGHYEQARTSSELAVAHYRALARVNPGRHRTALAHALGGLSLRHVRFGDLDQAVQTAREALDCFAEAEMGAGDIAAYRGEVLETLAIALRDLGRADEAVAAAREAVALREQLRATRPGGQASAAEALTTLADMLAAAEEWDESVACYEDAIEIARQLEAAQPDPQTRAVLGRALSNLAPTLHSRGDLDQARAAAEEAWELLHPLAEDQPAAYGADLARTAGNLARIGADLGQDHHEWALQKGWQGIAMYRVLSRSQPAVRKPVLASALYAFGVVCTHLHEYEHALAATEECVQLRRELAADDPARHLPGLATALGGLTVDLSNLDRQSEALAARLEQVELLRHLAATEPGRHDTDLADALLSLARRYEQASQKDVILAAAEEAARRYRSLAAQDPATHQVALAQALHALGACYGMAEHDTEGLAATEEAIALLTSLAQADLAEHSSWIASAEGNRAILRARLGLTSPAATAAGEG